MAREWRRLSVDQIKAQIEGAIAIGPFGSRMKSDRYVAKGVPVIRGNNISDTQKLVGEFAFVTPETADELRSSVVFPGDLVFPHRGAIGEVGIIPHGCHDRYILSTSLMKLTCNRKLVDPQFVFYFFRSNEGRHALLKNTSTVGTPGIGQPLSSLKSIVLPIPPLAEQTAIAQILGTLDEKIEVNRRMNVSLEAMGRALFTSWFVDFDPVRTKAGRPRPDRSMPFGNLFPTRLVSSELGEIPEGWKEGTFGTFVSQRSERVGAREAVVLSAVANGKLARSDDHFTKRVYSKETDKYLLVEQWDFAYNPSRINIGSIGMLKEAVLGSVSPVYVVVRPEPAYRWFLEFSIRRLHTKTWINTLASGSVRQSLSYADFASIPCVIPPEAIAQEFNRRWSAMQEGIRSHEAESRTLGDLRDLLLSELISGDLRLKDAEKFIRGAV